jgi:hypothetical protein
MGGPVLVALAVGFAARAPEPVLGRTKMTAAATTSTATSPAQ